MNSPITSNLTVNELADQWLQKLRSDGRLESTTVDEYQRVLRTLVEPGVGHKRLDELTTKDVNELLAELGRRSRNRQRKAKVILGAMLDFAVNDSVLPSNPVRGSQSISRPPASPPTITAAQVARIHEAILGSLRKQRPGPRSSADIGDIIEVMLGAGARIGEVLALRWSDVTWTPGPSHSTPRSRPLLARGPTASPLAGRVSWQSRSARRCSLSGGAA